MPITEARVREIYDDLHHGRLDRLAAAFDRNVDFLSHAPDKFFPYLGRRRGRTSVLEAISEMHRILQVSAFWPLTIVVNGHEAALTLFVDGKRKLMAAYHVCASSVMIPAPDEIG